MMLVGVVVYKKRLSENLGFVALQLKKSCNNRQVAKRNENDVSRTGAIYKKHDRQFGFVACQLKKGYNNRHVAKRKRK